MCAYGQVSVTMVVLFTSAPLRLVLILDCDQWSIELHVPVLMYFTDVELECSNIVVLDIMSHVKEKNYVTVWQTIKLLESWIFKLNVPLVT